MPGRLPQIDRLRGRTFKEFRVRGSQELAKVRERFLSTANEMSDGRFQRALEARERGASALDSASRIAARLEHSTRSKDSDSTRFFEALRSADEITLAMETRFAAQRTEILDRAAHAIEGCVQLFGLPELHLGKRARSLVTGHFSWERAAAVFSAVCEHAASRRARAASARA